MRLNAILIGLTQLILTTSSMADGVLPCPHCEQIRLPKRELIRLPLIEQTGWQEFQVRTGERKFVEVAVLEGSAAVELVPFGKAAAIRDVQCYREERYTYCEFVPAYDGLIGVAIQPATGSADALLEYGTTD